MPSSVGDSVCTPAPHRTRRPTTPTRICAAKAMPSMASRSPKVGKRLLGFAASPAVGAAGSPSGASAARASPAARSVWTCSSRGVSSRPAASASTGFSRRVSPPPGISSPAETPDIVGRSFKTSDSGRRPPSGRPAELSDTGFSPSGWRSILSLIILRSRASRPAGSRVRRPPAPVRAPVYTPGLAAFKDTKNSRMHPLGGEFLALRTAPCAPYPPRGGFLRKARLRICTSHNISVNLPAINRI